MRKLTKIAYLAIATLIASVALQSCGADGNHPGYEYMPNMYRSPYYDTYTQNPVFQNGITSQTPVKGSIPRGFIPFDFENTLEDYLRAGNELKSPTDINENSLKEGKELYEIFCKHCHGINGDGKGSINHPVYGGVPSYSDTIMPRRTGGSMRDLKSGNIYHAITYGLNAMGPHASQLTRDERWKIVNYVHELQKGPEQ